MSLLQCTTVGFTSLTENMDAPRSEACWSSTCSPPYGGVHYHSGMGMRRGVKMGICWVVGALAVIAVVAFLAWRRWTCRR